MDHDFAVLSPEKTILTYRLAGLGARVSAQLLDVVVVIALIIGISILGSLLAWVDVGSASAFSAVASFLVTFLYFILLEGLWNGQTLGKKAVGVRVRMADGTPVTFWAAIGRNLLRPADFLPMFYTLGVAAMFTNPKSQRIGDLVAGTIVIYEKRPNRAAVVAPHSVGVHQYESEVGELRGMTLEEYDALRRLCDRYPELTPETQGRLIGDVWEPIAKRRNVPDRPGVHPLYLAEAAVMKYGRQHGLL